MTCADKSGMWYDVNLRVVNVGHSLSEQREEEHGGRTSYDSIRHVNKNPVGFV